MGTRQGITWWLSCRLVLFVVVFSPGVFASQPEASTSQDAEHYTIVSRILYTGEGQYANGIERQVTVNKEPLAGSNYQYVISGSEGFDEISFTIDKQAREMSRYSDNAQLWALVNNKCMETLVNVTKENIGKTWQQRFDLRPVVKNMTTLEMTLAAIEIEHETLGKLIAVRSISSPFVVDIAGGTALSRINSVYLFDSEIEHVYLGFSVFESATTANGLEEVLRHEIVTYRTDSNGNAVNLKGLGETFDRFIAHVGIDKEFEVKQPVDLPQWARTDGLKASQISNISSSLACEGNMNPVISLAVSSAQLALAQVEGTPSPAAGPGNPWTALVNKVGIVPAVGIVGGAIAIPIAVSNSGGGSSKSVSP